MPATWQPRPEVESVHVIYYRNTVMVKRIGESTADDSHGWIFAEVVYNWWRHEIPVSRYFSDGILLLLGIS